MRFYSVMGHRPEEPGALAMMAEMLCQSGTDEQIALAMTRCSKECQFPVRLPDFMQRIPGLEISKAEAEMRGSWDVLMKYVSKWGRWGEDYHHAYIEQEAPTLPARIVDTVRRTGGWGAYLQLSYSTDQRARDANFEQQRYYEEYKAWTAVEHAISQNEAIAALEAPRSALRLATREAPGAATEVAARKQGQ
ncbi:MAG TPA: hypothetical protein VK763_14385 [Terriglobales bacterium]|nr:hypothetical protein [Terriglobales bacterium]